MTGEQLRFWFNLSVGVPIFGLSFAFGFFYGIGFWLYCTVVYLCVMEYLKQTDPKEFEDWKKALGRRKKHDAGDSGE